MPSPKENNVLKYFVSTLNDQYGLDYIFYPANEIEDAGGIDGWMINSELKIPIQLTSAKEVSKNKNPYKESFIITKKMEELAKKSLVTNEDIESLIMDSTQYPFKEFVENSIKAKAIMDLKDSCLVITYIYTDSPWDRDQELLSALDELKQFRAVYAFFPSTEPDIICIKSLSR